MAKPTDTVPPWASAGNYVPSVYDALTVQTIPNPLAGLPTPWSGTPRTEAGTLAAFAAQGLSPQIPTAAQEFNEWLQRVGEWANWVEAGSAVDGADAHIVETDALGAANLQAGVFTIGVFGKAGAAVILGNGAIVPTGKSLTLSGTATVFGGAGSAVLTGLVDAVTVEAASVVYDDSGAVLDIARGATRWNLTSLMGGDGAHARAVSIPDRGFDATFTTTNAIDDTTASCLRQELDEDEPVWITITARFESDAAAQLLNTKIKVIGSISTEDLDSDSYYIDVAAVGYSYSRTFLWVPTDTYALPGTASYTFIARFGITGGNTLLMTNVSIKCEGALRLP